MLKAELETEVRRLTQERDAAQKAVDELVRKQEEHLRRIGVVAMSYARENDWCETVRDALHEADVPCPNHKVEMEIVLKVTATTDGGISGDPEESMRRWIENSINITWDDIQRSDLKLLDTDWTEVEVTDITVGAVSLK